MSNPAFSKMPFLKSLLALSMGSSLLFAHNAMEEPPAFVIDNQTAVAHSSEELIAPEASTDEEAFLIRRIAEFWKDGDFRIVKKQIVEFFEKYPNSSLKEYFLGILGDLYLQENNPTLALEAYEQVQDPKIREKVLINKLHCYYDLNRYSAIAEEGKPYLDKDTPEFAHRKNELKFLVAEGLFRQSVDCEDDNLQKRQCYEEALPLYESLQKTPYGEVATFALAETNRVLENRELAASLYLDLAKRYPEQRDDLLFQAGNLQAHFAPKEAIGTFTQIIENNSKRSAEATFNRLVLLFKTEQYTAVLEDYEKVASIVPNSYLPTFHYIVGKSYYALDQYQDALKPLSQFIETQKEPSEQMKNALLIQMTSAQKLSDEPLFSESLTTFETLFPEDEELPKALFLHAVMLKETGNISLASEKLAAIKERFPNFESEEPFLFEYGYLAHEQEDWTRCYDTFAEYNTRYHDTENSTTAWKIFFSSALHRVESNDPNYTKEQFYNDLQKVLSIENLFSEKELITYQLLHAKTLFELNRCDECYNYAATLITTIDPEKETSSLAEAHYISALSLYELQKNHLDFCMHLETALELDPETYDNSSTHVHLFNGYLIASGLHNTKEDANTRLVDKAAEHLYTATEQENPQLQTQNVLWLANHYFHKVKDYTDRHWSHTIEDSDTMREYARRAESLFTQELLTEGTQLKKTEQEAADFEAEVLKLAQLYELKGALDKKLTLISALLEHQSKATSVSWNYRKHALFELAQTYKELGNTEKALETYDYIAHFTTNLPTVMSHRATYEAAKIQFSLINPNIRDETNDEILNVLNQLKELQIRKNPLSEPLHLEAGLEYAKIRARLTRNEDRPEREAFFLHRFKEDFCSQEDSIGRDYHSLLSEKSGKKRVFDNYMKFVEAELLRLQAEQQLGEQSGVNNEELSERVLSILQEIQEDRTTPRELHERTQESIQKINALNTY